MPINDAGNFMFFGPARNDVHQRLLVADPRIKNVVVLDHKNYTLLPPFAIKVFVSIRWSDEPRHERQRVQHELEALVKNTVGATIQTTVSIIEDFGDN